MEIKKAQGMLIGIFFLFTAIYLFGCQNGGRAQNAWTDPQAQPDIINGRPPVKGNMLAKSVVAIVSQMDQGEALCTGSILTEDAILTAAHCVEGNPSKIAIIFGQNVQLAVGEEIRYAVGVGQNPKWKNGENSGLGDVAVILFSGGLPQGYAPMTLAPKEMEIQQGSAVSFLGYGVTNGETHVGSGVLRFAQSSVIAQKNNTQIITDGTKSSVCFGDSGGPGLIAYNGGFVQWGVASSVMNQACNEASVHTTVMEYEPWMNSAITKLRKSIDPINPPKI